MARTKAVQRFKGDSSDIEARIISAIAVSGPRNLAEISRMTGVHQETIRYKIKKRFDRLGFQFHAEVDFAKIGLNLSWARLDFSKEYQKMAPQVLRALNKVGYLTYYAKTVPQGNYIALFALPQDTSDQYREIFSGLSGDGILAHFDLNEVIVSRHKGMDPEFFNFASARWEVEWERLKLRPPVPLPPAKKTHSRDFDFYDLLVIKELQVNASQHLTSMAKKLKIHPKTLEYHYRTHIQKWRLVPSYWPRWSQDTTKRLIHSVAGTLLNFHDLNRKEFDAVQSAVSKIPFLWTEDILQNGDYIATIYTPVTDMVNVVSYIDEAVPGLSSKVEMALIKPSESTSFTIPYNMFQDGRWKFDLGQIKTALRREAVLPIQK